MTHVFKLNRTILGAAVHGSLRFSSDATLINEKLFKQTNENLYKQGMIP